MMVRAKVGRGMMQCAQRAATFALAYCVRKVAVGAPGETQRAPGSPDASQSPFQSPVCSACGIVLFIYTPLQQSYKGYAARIPSMLQVHSCSQSSQQTNISTN